MMESGMGARCARHQGFTLIEMIGVLAVLAILSALIAPNVIRQLNAATQDAETQNLEAVGLGVELYLRELLVWPPALVNLSPDYVPYGNTQITQNSRGFPRYFVVHPTTAGFVNDVGITATNVPDARFLLISDLSQDAAPGIVTGADFDAYWNRDETSNAPPPVGYGPDLKIYRGHASPLFHLVSLSTTDNGGISPIRGSYQIGATATGSGGGPVPPNSNYHLVGTNVGLDEANAYVAPEIQFILSLDAGYQFEPDCPAGAMWTTFGSGCSP